jgi:hypothetical protein
MVNARRALLGLLLGLASCGRSNGLEPSPDAGADTDADCCAISASWVSGGCVDVGGSWTLNGSACINVCGSFGQLVRTTDGAGCPKLVPAACVDAGPDVQGCW